MKLRCSVVSCLTVLLSSVSCSTTAFAITSPVTTTTTTTSSRTNIMTTIPTKTKTTNNNDSLLRIRGGGGGSSGTAVKAAAASAPPAPPAKKAKKLRILALDGIRFVLAMHIVLGHFLRFANPSEFWLKFFAQINITVGAFFALSGYVAAYTSTEVGKLEASSRLTDTPSQKWWLSKCMSYYPMHWLVLLLFSPMFIYVNLNQGSGWLEALIHGLMSITLTQAWFPMHAEVWNAPTWYLSSLTFSTAILPFALPKMAKMNKKSLRKSGIWLFIIKLLPILGYVYDHGTLNIVEGMTPPKAHPAYSVFNTQRFHPVFNTADILLGVIACRLAMLDTYDDKDETKPLKTTNWLSSMIPALGLLGVLGIRGTTLVPDISDMLVRSLVFTPLFLKFVMSMHRNAVAGIKNDIVSNILSSKLLVWLGGLSFPIYIVHGPIGQVFYKRLIAGKLWGGVLKGPKFFAIYLTTVFLSALFLQKFFLQNKAVGTWSKNKVEQFSTWM